MAYGAVGFPTGRHGAADRGLDGGFFLEFALGSDRSSDSEG